MSLRNASWPCTLRRFMVVWCAFSFATLSLAAQTLTILHSFRGIDGAQPLGGLIMDAAGNLYGTTQSGGAHNKGVIFKIKASNLVGDYQVLYEFSGDDGDGPSAALIMDAAGNLYGTTEQGGPSNRGVVFKVKTSGSDYTILHEFTGDDGTDPLAGLLMGDAGSLYGTTFFGGTDDNGVVFKLNTSGSDYRILHRFSYSDGANPSAELVMDTEGNLYGTAQTGGADKHGVAFEIINTSGGDYAVLHNFGGADGVEPFARLLIDAAENLYGTTADGGTDDHGVVFKIDTLNHQKVLHNFSIGDGAGPTAGLVMDAAGNLYGTTDVGGIGGNGVIFRISKSGGKYEILHKFSGSDGSHPYAGLIMDAAGNLYGTTGGGGPSDDGTVFKLSPH